MIDETQLSALIASPSYIPIGPIVQENLWNQDFKLNLYSSSQEFHDGKNLFDYYTRSVLEIIELMILD
jgi:hypothetical protein